MKDESLKKLFEEATSSDFEIAVVATMSSGKSTFINVIMDSSQGGGGCLVVGGQQLLSQYDDEAECFSAVSYDSEGRPLEKCECLNLEGMKRMNDDPRTSMIEIRGNIPYIKSTSIRLVLTDTPGPNNSQEKAHEKHTLGLLDKDYKPMVLYVLNATQLGIDDDSNLLNTIAQKMKVGDRQSSDRFIFVLNKADEINPQKEPVPETIEKARKYLGDKKIDNPRLFPCSSMLAKVIRMAQNKLELTEDEQDFLDTRPRRFIENSQRHLSDHAQFLSPETGRLLNQGIFTSDASWGQEPASPVLFRCPIRRICNYGVSGKVCPARKGFQWRTRLSR